MGEQGLVKTMQTLQTKFTENGVPMADFFTKSQALKASLGILGTQSEKLTSNLDDMTESTGFIGDAFATTAETDAFKMEQAMNNLKVAGTSLGDSLAPVIQTISDKIMSLTEWWNGLDKSTKDNYASWLVWIATVGPALWLIGGIITKVGAFIGLIKKFQVITKIATAVQWLWNAAMTANPIGVIIMLVAALIGAIVYFATSSSGVAVKVRNGFKWMANGVITAINWIIEKINAVGEYVGFTIPVIAKFEMESTDNLDQTGDAVEDVSADVEDLTKNLNTIPPVVPVTIDPVVDGESGGGDDKASKKKEEAEAKSLERIRKLKQKFNVLNTGDKQKADLIALENQRDNALLGVDDTKYAEQEKLAINANFNKKKKKLLDKHEEDNEKAADAVKSAWEISLKSIEEGWNTIKDVAGQVFDAITALGDQQAAKEQTELENDQIKEQELYDSWYASELLKIETSTMTKKSKEDAIAALDEKASQKKIDLEKKQDAESKALNKKAAQREKKLNIFNAIINTASAVVKALASSPPPLNFALAAGVGIAGAMQIAAISSTPIPLADGGLAFGPTNAIVGEYSGARNNPEVIAPLDKLKSLMGGGSRTSDIKMRGQLKGNDIFLSTDKTIVNRLRFI